jgi:replicative DNA helicase
VRQGIDEYLPPQSVESEEALLGCALKDPQAMAKVLTTIKYSSAFYSPRHQVIFAAMLLLASRNEPIDIATVAGELNAMNKLAETGGRSYMIDLVEATASTANIAVYTRTVHEAAQLRKVIAICNDTIENCYKRKGKTKELIDAWQQAAFEVGRDREGSGFQALADDNEDWLARVDELQAGKAQLRRIHTGFTQIDHLIHGMVPGEFVAVAGATGAGKTEFALQVALHVAYTQNKPVGVVSLEMLMEEVNSRIQCAEAGVDYDTIETPQKLTEVNWHKLVEAATTTKKPMIYVDDSAMVTPAELMANARTLVANKKIELLIVDYLQLMDLVSGDETREREVAKFARCMKVMAKELNIVVMGLSQITQMPGKVPGMGSFRESRAIGHTANIAFFTHLEEKKTMIVVGKNRRGPSNKGVTRTVENRSMKISKFCGKDQECYKIGLRSTKTGSRRWSMCVKSSPAKY